MTYSKNVLTTGTYVAYSTVLLYTLNM